MTVAVLTEEDQLAVDQLTFERVAKKRCACRGVIVVATPEAIVPRDIERAVARHRETFGHRTWQQAGGMEQLLTAREQRLMVPDAPPIRRVV